MTRAVASEWVSTGTTLDIGTPMVLFQANAKEPLATPEQRFDDVSKDGQHFLINTQVRNADTQPMGVVLNWDASMKK